MVYCHSTTTLNDCEYGRFYADPWRRVVYKKCLRLTYETDCHYQPKTAVSHQDLWDMLCGVGGSPLVVAASVSVEAFKVTLSLLKVDAMTKNDK